MERVATLKLLVFMVSLLVIYPKAKSQWLPHHPLPPSPLCASQLALVNNACKWLPYEQTPPPSPPAPEPTPPPEPTPTPPPTPAPTPPAPNGTRHHHHRHDHGHNHGRHGHGHGHGHAHAHGHRKRDGTPVEEDCCHWLQQIDTECVCGLLVKLPSFLTRPLHNYTVMVDDTCDVTFSCGSRIVPGAIQG